MPIEPQSPWDITAAELSQLVEQGHPLFLLDVRQAHEHEFCNFGGTLIPLGELPNRIDELDKQADIVVYCRMGVRSADACYFLRNAGFPYVRNLQGGILAWSDQVDPSVPKY